MRLSHHFEYFLTFGIHKTEYFCREYFVLRIYSFITSTKYPLKQWNTINTASRLSAGSPRNLLCFPLGTITLSDYLTREICVGTDDVETWCHSPTHPLQLDYIYPEIVSALVFGYPCEFVVRLTDIASIKLRHTGGA